MSKHTIKHQNKNKRVDNSYKSIIECMKRKRSCSKEIFNPIEINRMNDKDNNNSKMTVKIGNTKDTVAHKKGHLNVKNNVKPKTRTNQNVGKNLNE